MSSLLDKAIYSGDIFNVEMNTVHFISFRNYRGIGTSNLNSCTAVMIVSSSGAILAHIAPRPPFARSDDPYAGDRHVMEKMDEMGSLYRQYKKHFSADKPSWIGSALYGGEVALPNQTKIIKSKLQGWGLNPSNENYNVVKAPLPANGKGTVFIDAREGGFPIVYVEDRQVNRNSSILQAQTHSLPQLQGSAYFLQDPTYPSQRSTYPPQGSTYPPQGSTYPPQGSTYRLPQDYASSPEGYASSSQGYASSSHDYAPSSQTLQTASDSQAPKPGQPYYYVSNKIYYYHHSNGQEIALDKCPDKIWVYNENGWSKSPNCKWRRTNGTSAKNAEYSQ